jgi:hypothetical protein
MSIEDEKNEKVSLQYGHGPDTVTYNDIVQLMKKILNNDKRSVKEEISL